MTAPAADLAAPRFPPLYRGEAVPARTDPLDKALAGVALGVEPGRLIWSQDVTVARAAVVLAPEMPLARAMGAVLAAELGLADAIGALAPPEVAVHFRWPDRLTVNAAACGTVRAAASTRDPDTEPDWLIVDIAVPMLPTATDPGARPDQTTLADEGCVDITAPILIESWSKHMLVWINTFIEDGMAPVHRAWNAKCDVLGEAVTYPRPGTFLGLDELGGMLLRDGEDRTDLIPLTRMLEAGWPSSPA